MAMLYSHLVDANLCKAISSYHLKQGNNDNLHSHSITVDDVFESQLIVSKHSALSLHSLSCKHSSLRWNGTVLLSHLISDHLGHFVKVEVASDRIFFRCIVDESARMTAR